MNYEKILEKGHVLLLTGETGTGKSRFAYEIYRSSKWNNRGFQVAHLASLKEELFESELFGHEKGAFTGAHGNKVGYCGAVGDGILFLDEVGEISMEQQKKLLYLLEEKKYTPVGSTLPRDFRGKIILATNRDLGKMVEEKSFREDLYFRIMGFQIQMPPLRVNQQKLRSYIETTLNKESRLKVEMRLLNRLLSYSWPGNYRELNYCLEYLLLSENLELGEEDLPFWFLDKKIEPSQNFAGYPLDYHKALEKFEEAYLKHVLTVMGGKVNKTSEEIRMSKSTLIAKIRKYEINIWKIKEEKGRRLAFAS